MTLRASRRALAATLLLLACLCLIFYHRQNAGLQTGGAISLPKMLWLAYAIAAWFVLPFFLWRDARLDARLRRVFGVFWLLMIARGAAELPLLYFFEHWNPLYGIAHDVVCVVAIARVALAPR